MVGRMTGDLAHDFNNLLTVIAQNVACVLSDMAEEHTDRAMLQAALDATFRGAGLIRQLPSVARPRRPPPRRPPPPAPPPVAADGPER